MGKWVCERMVWSVEIDRRERAGVAWWGGAYLEVGLGLEGVEQVADALHVFFD